ncbi:RagB/SusD family nutrient uptake outer membrane protein [Pontibacter sp. FD36]|uniref:RagB/SusD family nutrient uptake outer membrane protein n=1 Tax=Pontibacter sp. FD36 TaxID=2789860 RepID=UPI0018A97FAE|nr:RagB/SusD family nutrient uptake outer membrane protein [Pontibacter sp. FD36]MBF8964841.1 RagB/SusD family nutrient uptake outer membrane protein [Pontibacter sp. FD36]
MKKFIYSSLTACMLVFASCDKDYLELRPTNAVSDQDVFTTTKNAWGAINGIHRSLYFQWGNMDQAGQGGAMVHLDMLGEDVVMTSAGNGWFNSTYQWQLHRNANASSVKWLYYMYYRAIVNANNIIENIDNAEGPEAEKNAIKGQAYAYRAWAHFNAVQLYAQRYDANAKPNSQLGVPLLTTATIEPQPRATVEEVYAQVNADLDQAIGLLTTTRSNKSHLNINVAKGIKARVALTMQDWATAAQYAAEARTGFALMSNAAYTAGFNSASNTEWMWGSIQLDDQQTYFHSFFAFMSANFNSTNIRTNPKAINSALYDKISATDVRKQLWDPTGASIPVPPNGEKKPYANKKFLAKSSSLSVGDVPLMRVAEMYLIEAEAKARLGLYAEAADALYPLAKNRDAAYEKSTLTGQDLINEIMTQRRVELWGEGFRFLDLKRTNSPLDRSGANHNSSLVGSRAWTVPAGSIEWQFLIPQDEVNANPNIEQNPL